MNAKLDYNKNLIGRTAVVADKMGDWSGKIIDVLDPETFIVDKSGESIKVDIFDIASTI
jgi:hypothetical protein